MYIGICKCQGHTGDSDLALDLSCVLNIAALCALIKVVVVPMQMINNPHKCPFHG